MRRRFREEADVDQLIMKWYNTYILEELENPDDEIPEMYMFDEYFAGKNPLEIAEDLRHGQTYSGGEHSKFNPNDDYFAWDNLGWLMSMSKSEALELMTERLEDYDGGVDAFISWCKQNNYATYDESARYRRTNH